jgi:hypothetical protein
MRRRLVMTMIASVTSFTLAIAGAPPALAMGQTPVPSWMTNGKLFASVIGNGRIYLGGQFTQVRSTPLGTPGPRFTVRNVGALDLATGEGVSGFDPLVTHATENAFVRALALSPDGSTLYIGGRFDAVDGVTVRNVAAINTADGSIDSSFRPNVGSLKNQVFSLLVSPDGSTLYVGGKFARAEGATRGNLAAFDTSDGSLLDWAPSANDNVRAMDFASDNASIFMVGAFSTVNGLSRESIARVDVSTGATHPWFVPGVLISGPPMTGWSVDASATTVFAGFGRGPNWFASYNATTGSRNWQRGTNGNVQKVLLSEDGTQLFVAGHFGTGRLNQTFSECGSTLFRGLLVANPVTGTVDCSWIPQLAPSGNNFQGLWDLDLTATELWFAGNFSSVNGVDQANVARAAR